MIPRVIRTGLSPSPTDAPRQLGSDPAERVLAGRVLGILWTIGGATLLLLPVLPGAPLAHGSALAALAGFSLAAGVVSLLLVDWNRASPLVLHVMTLAAVAAAAGAVAESGGAMSSAWIPFLWIGLFAAAFLEPRVAALYLLLCIAAQALPLVYDRGDALADGFVAQLASAAAGYATMGGAVVVGKSALRSLRDRAEVLAAEQGALRRLATAVVGGEPTDRVHEVAAAEAAGLFSADVVVVLRCTSQCDSAEVVGIAGGPALGSLKPGTGLPIRPGSLLARATTAGSAVLGELHPQDLLDAAMSTGAVGMAAPVLIDGSVWGLVIVAARFPRGFDREDAAKLETLCGLLASAEHNLADRAQLAADALTDPLTGLANQRALHSRLKADASAAARHGRPLSVAMLDLDNFKEVNDSGGHAAGDAVLRRVAGALRALARAEDTVGRIGGDEFMWILPDTVGEDAVVALERARALIAHSVSDDVLVTASAGVCDTHTTCDPTELVRRADRALYTSKTDGRDRVRVYDAAAAGEAARHEREEWVARTHALTGLRALARAVDAKDPSTREHSKRVAVFAGQLAEAAGWAPERVMRLCEAALVHDVGKLGVPDRLLVKPGRLTAGERDQMIEHAELSARMVGSVLDPEQVEWIRDHHERPDGGGYPRGVRGTEISEGAGLMALAEAWDVMMAGRTYSARKTASEALAECTGLTNAQFTADAVQALRSLAATGSLGGASSAVLAGTRHP